MYYYFYTKSEYDTKTQANVYPEDSSRVQYKLVEDSVISIKSFIVAKNKATFTIIDVKEGSFSIKTCIAKCFGFSKIISRIFFCIL